MASYVDGYVVPVPKRNLKKYQAMASKCGKVWKKYGALEYVECVADDVKGGKWTSFPQSVKKKPNETIFFAYVFFRSRAHRVKVNKKAMNDPAMKALCAEHKAGDMPFDGKRMFWGGFKTIVKA